MYSSSKSSFVIRSYLKYCKIMCPKGKAHFFLQFCKNLYFTFSLNYILKFNKLIDFFFEFVID